MAGTEPLNEDGSPHIAKLKVEHEMEEKMVQKKTCLKSVLKQVGTVFLIKKTYLQLTFLRL